MRILITGAAGFIGNRLLEYFMRKGNQVIGWDRVAIGEYIKVVDLMNETKVVEELKSFKPEIIVHCAGCADVHKSVLCPTDDYCGNVTITHNLLFAIHQAGIKKIRFVFLSSASVYGNPRILPITEDAELNPLSPYALHKVMCEDMCLFFIRNYGIDIKIARIFSAYGEGLRKQIFWDMYNKFIQTGKLDMFGSGNESRDYIHVDDVVQALYLLSISKTEENFFNVANGYEITIKEVSELFASSYNIDSSIIQFNGIIREGDPLNWKADITRIKKIGYKQNVEIGKGMARYCEWLTSQ